MDSDLMQAGPLTIVLVMAIVTLATRWGGVYVMSLMPFSNRMKTFIQAMSGSVLVAILAPVAAEGDKGAQMALLTTALLMLLLKRPLLAISGGIIVCALIRHI
ncbi:AzlD domain-containing protein [Enterobacteriaceae bacterium RIT693]|jgi:uncharacterized membrane protein|nr:AzlD domain-containing protein [Enterobacteriaceae bacterium RIT693]